MIRRRITSLDPKRLPCGEELGNEPRGRVSCAFALVLINTMHIRITSVIFQKHDLKCCPSQQKLWSRAA